jgi:hypothetical protein
MVAAGGARSVVVRGAVGVGSAGVRAGGTAEVMRARSPFKASAVARASFTESPSGAEIVACAGAGLTPR